MKHLLQAFEPLRCTKHPQASLVNVCAHVLDGAAPHYADEDTILCYNCTEATEATEDATRPLWPVCVACLRINWNLTLRAILDDLHKEKTP